MLCLSFFLYSYLFEGGDATGVAGESCCVATQLEPSRGILRRNQSLSMLYLTLVLSSGGVQEEEEARVRWSPPWAVCPTRAPGPGLGRSVPLGAGSAVYWNDSARSLLSHYACTQPCGVEPACGVQVCPCSAPVTTVR
jgi:hypothetical protein